MSFGISALSIIPLRREQAERSEMISQVLFGEIYEVLEQTEKWMLIRTIHDGCEGWINKNQYKEIGEDFIRDYTSEIPVLTTEVFNIVCKKGDYSHKLIASGSVLPFLDIDKNEFLIGEDTYILNSRLKDISIDHIRDLLVEYALMYYNTPYLWGGRTPYGIDCSGLIQMVYRLAGNDLPREVSMQAQCGYDLSFLEEALPGDLAFFGDELGEISHIGIIWKENRIIHASGKVRIDKIDHNGIYNEELKRYTHQLRVIKRVVE